MTAVHSAASCRVSRMLKTARKLIRRRRRCVARQGADQSGREAHGQHGGERVDLRPSDRRNRRIEPTAAYRASARRASACPGKVKQGKVALPQGSSMPFCATADSLRRRNNAFFFAGKALTPVLPRFHGKTGSGLKLRRMKHRINSSSERIFSPKQRIQARGHSAAAHGAPSVQPPAPGGRKASAAGILATTVR